MKKLLLVNTKYREFGGEDSNILEEKHFLSKYYDVKYLEYDNSSKIGLSDLKSFITNNNSKSNKALLKVFNSFKPDIVYIHNTWFKANLGLFKVLKRLNARVILKVHNFRFSCSDSYFSKFHLSGQDYCHKCGFNKTNSIFNKYYEDSYIKSFLLIRYGKKYIKILQKYNLKILVMTKFQKTYLHKLGINKEKIKIYENPITDLENTKNKYNKNSDYIVYAGRITGPKGVENLLNSWKNCGFENIILKIIGVGEDLDKLQNAYHGNVEFLGKISNEETLKIIKDSLAVVTATQMYEGQPRLLCEASSMGVPSIFPNFGGMVEFFPEDYKLKFEQYNYLDLEKKLYMLKDNSLLESLSYDVKNYIDKKLSDNTLKTKFEENFK